MEFLETMNVDKIVERSIEILFGLAIIIYLGVMLFNWIKDEIKGE